MPVKAELIGQSFGRLVVKGEMEGRYNGKVKWRCVCLCGNIAEVTTGDLNSGRQESCGCIKTTHGLSQTRVYKIWRGVLDRTSNKNFDGYANYGGRGITVSEDWLTFEGFYKDMGGSYFDLACIDRIDNEKGYCVTNCRWVTPAQNNYNTGPCKGTSSVFKGVSLCQVNNKWKVGIGHKGVHHHLGYFIDENEAARVYNEKAKELFGEYAYLNKVLEE